MAVGVTMRACGYTAGLRQQESLNTLGTAVVQCIKQTLLAFVLRPQCHLEAIWRPGVHLQGKVSLERPRYRLHARCH